jgi:hypothetical protein
MKFTAFIRGESSDAACAPRQDSPSRIVADSMKDCDVA